MLEIFKNPQFREFLLAQISTFVIGSGILLWFIKLFFTHLASKDIETFKSTLNKELETFKHELNLLNSKQVTVFTDLHKQRADFIRECHERISDTHIAFQSWVSPLKYQDSDEPKQAKAAVEEFNALVKFYNKKKIYFPEQINGKIVNFLDVLDQAAMDFGVAQATSSELREARAATMKAAWKQVSKDAVVIKKDLEDEFRKMLGVI